MNEKIKKYLISNGVEPKQNLILYIKFRIQNQFWRIKTLNLQVLKQYFPG